MGASPIPSPVPISARVAPSARMLRLASDERLVEHVRNGSQPAFEVVYDRHHRGILAFCRHMLRSPEEAEDALQHTFIAAYRDLLGSDKDIQLRAWLYAIARNRCLTMLRARRDHPVDELEDVPYDGLAAQVQQRQDLKDLVRDVSSLPEDQRAALVLSELGDMSHDEIAAVIGCPTEKVKALVFQARTSLQSSRQARDTSCEEIRELLANLRGGSLRRGVVRRHVRECDGCRTFQAEVKHQRRALAVVLPVIPAAGLKHSTLAAAFASTGTGVGAAGIAAGGGAVGGVTAAAGAAATSTLATGAGLGAKALVVAVLATGGVAGVNAVKDSDKPVKPAPSSKSTGQAGGSGGGAPAIAPVATPESTSGPGKRTRTRPHGNRRGHTDRGKAFAQTRGQKLGKKKASRAPAVKARNEARRHARSKARANAKAKVKRQSAVNNAQPARPTKPAPTPRPARTPRRPVATSTPAPTVAPTEEAKGRGSGRPEG